MKSKHYEIRVLPLFVSELREILEYIEYHLYNPQAAYELEQQVYDAIVARSSCAEAFEPYQSKFTRQYTFYRIYVKHYTIFYAVIGDIMEVQSIVYSKRNVQDIL